jgi:hypothetical protein
VPPPKVYPPTVAPTSTPVFNFKPLPDGFNPGGWCVKVAASAVHLPDGHRLESQDGFVYLSPEALGLRLIVERHNWFYDFTFGQCGQYQ